MQIRMVIRFPGWLVLVALAGTAGAGPLEDAAAAHDRGDDVTAVRLLLPLAEGGDGFAQFALGLIYDTAKGIPQDDVAAAKWYRKEDDQGIAGAAHRVDARIVVEKRSDALTIPLGALFKRGDDWATFVVTDGRAHLRSIKLGPRGTRQAVVEKGLEPGERVIIYPTDAVRDGARVRLRDAEDGQSLR